MTNIRPNQTMELLQKVAHPDRHSIVLIDNKTDKGYWQKVWLIERLVQTLGFVKEEKL